MKSTLIIAAIAAVARAQEIDWEAYDSVDKPTPVSAPIGGGTETINYDENAAAASVVAEVKSTTDDAPQRRDVLDNHIRINAKRAPCEAQPLGAGPVSSPDTAAAFLSDDVYAAKALAAPVPSGYRQTFSNLAASSSAYGYMGFVTLQSYDTALCASKCNAINGCSAINIYFERDPTVEPAAACPNPPSTTNIKCVFWGGPVTKENANNAGGWRNEFQVVIAGSNGYVCKSIATQDGYTGPTYLGNTALNAPLDCSGGDTFMGSKTFANGPFDAGLCAAACSAQSAYNIRYPPKTGKPKTCQFFTTYMLLKNGVPEAQQCSMYTMAWDSSYAKYTGQNRGNDKYTISYSYTFVNSTNPGKPAIPCAVASASSAIKSATLQPYCSSLLGYTAPVTTATASTIVTVPAGTSTSNVVPLATAVVTSTQLVTVTPVHDDNNPDGTVVDQIPVPEVITETVEGVAPTEIPAVARRDAVPGPLANVPADVVSSACSLVATPVTTTSTAFTTKTSTVTSGFIAVTITASPSTTTSTTVVTSTTTILVAPSVPS